MVFNGITLAGLGDLIADVDFIDSVPEVHTSIAIGFLVATCFDHCSIRIDIVSGGFP